MTAGTETVLEEGMAWGCLDGGGMLIDRDSGEFVPAEQVIKDPLHVDKLDFLQEDHLGPLKATMVTNEAEGDEAVEDERGDDTTNGTFNMLALTHEAENDPLVLHDEPSEENVDLYIPHSSQKRRRPEFRSRKKGHK